MLIGVLQYIVANYYNTQESSFEGTFSLFDNMKEGVIFVKDQNSNIKIEGEDLRLIFVNKEAK